MSDTPQISGKTTIAPEVLHTIARLAALSIPGVSRMSQVPPAVRMDRLFKPSAYEGVLIELQDDAVYADLYIVLRNDINIREVSRKIQQEVARAISEMVGMQVGRVNIHVEDIDYPTETEA